MNHKLIIGILLVALVATGTSTAWLAYRHREHQQLEKDYKEQRRLLCHAGKFWIGSIERELLEKGDQAHTQVSMLFGISTTLAMEVITLCMPEEEPFVRGKITDFRTYLGVARNSKAARQELADLRDRLQKYLIDH